METLIIPEGVAEIKDNEYRGRKDITAVKFPSTLKKIGARAFDGCTSLRIVDLPEGIETIGDYAFDSEKLIYVPGSIQYIGERAFSYSVVFLENKEGGFKHYEAWAHYEHPDSFHRGTDGSGSEHFTFYFSGTVFFEAKREDFLRYLGELPVAETESLVLKFPKENKYIDFWKFLTGKDEFSPYEFFLNVFFDSKTRTPMLFDKSGRFLGSMAFWVRRWGDGPSLMTFVDAETEAKYREEVEGLYAKVGWSKVPLKITHR